MDLNWLVFEKIAFLYFGDRQTDRQTHEQMDNTDALSRCLCRERRLNNAIISTPKSADEQTVKRQPERTRHNKNPRKSLRYNHGK